MRIAEAFNVTPINPDRGFKAMHYEPSPNGLIAKEVVTTGGFLVKFPNGNSIRVESVERLKAMGLDAGSSLVDLDSGETVPVNTDGSVDFRAMVATSAKGLSEERQLDLLGERDTDDGEE